MRYLSTRGGMAPQTFTEVLLGGLAPDGGLVVPEQIPVVAPATLERWRTLSYADLAFEVLSLYCDDIAPDTLQTLIHRTYTAERFGSEAITPLKTLDSGNGSGTATDDSPGNSPLYLLGLSEGPTLAFKDIAMQLLGELFEYELTRRNEHLNILGATSGDTGSAAEYAMRGKSHIRVFMLSPLGRMSPFQQAQMYSLTDPNIFNIVVDGVFDDCQDIVKAVSNDHAFKKRHAIGTVNSINWARVVAQVVYYFRGWYAATDSNEQAVSFCVPTGNFGNVLAGHIARRMGVPIRRLVVATNENDVLDEFFRTGVYRVRSASQTHATSSPSMDISKSSNFERFVLDLVGGDANRLRELWQQLDSTGAFDLSGTEAFARIADYGFVSGASDHATRVRTIGDWYRRSGVLFDPHTADGVAVAQGFREVGVPMICLETALPAKFAETIVEATGQQPPVPPALADLPNRVKRFSVLPCELKQLKGYIAARTESA